MRRRQSLHGLLALGLYVASPLLSYGSDVGTVFRRSADYLDRILRGAKPADLPFEMASTLQMGAEPEHRASPRPRHPERSSDPGRRGHRMNLQDLRRSSS